MKKAVKSILSACGVFASSTKVQRIKEGTIDEIDPLFDLILQKAGGGESHAQLKQDVFALAMNGFKRAGFFVEFGATDGKSLSNTYTLEKDFGWSGILAEPARMWHDALRANRTCKIETDCVWRETGQTLAFSMANDGEFSTLSQFTGSDGHSAKRDGATTYDVTTVSLNDLLIKHEAPEVIDYLSIDTEGSEFEILNAFDFSAHRFNCITVEHNGTAARDQIRALLEGKGYRRAFTYLSKWDDWYVPA